MLGLCFLLLAATLANADLPIDCRFQDAVGVWYLKESARTADHSEPCTSLGEVVHTKTLALHYPNQVVDEIGNVGTWTLVYNQGFEVTINERSYWAPFHHDLKNKTFACDRLSVGYSHDATVRHWSCFTAIKLGAKDQLRKQKFEKKKSINLDAKFENDLDFIDQLNAAQSSWTAKAYPQHEQYTHRQIIQRSGTRKFKSPGTKPATEALKVAASYLPKSFDWRDVEGINYLSPVRNQGNCGSCYAFSSVGMVESRLRIATNLSRQDIFSPQDIVSCSRISEGCGGGFPYLIAGRYAHEQGFVAESCTPYRGEESSCGTADNCPRTYTDDFAYVGGYYGGSSEEAMLLELVAHGPMSVGFEVHPDFKQYTGGIYHYVKNLTTSFDPFYLFNHCVLLVGYGEEGGQNFWTVKNSWGIGWGEAGYFRIRRGGDECGIESVPFATKVIP